MPDEVTSHGMKEAAAGGEEHSRGKLLELLAKLDISLGTMNQHMEHMSEAERKRHQINQNIFPLSVEGIFVNSNATTDQPNILGPRTGWIWDIHSVIITGLGAAVSAGAVAGWVGAVVTGASTVTGTKWFNATSDAQFNWGKNQFVLQAGQRIILQGTSALVPTAGAQVGIFGMQIHSTYYGDYSL